MRFIVLLLPLASLLNAIVILILTILHIPLTPLSIFGSLLLVLIIAFFALRKRRLTMTIPPLREANFSRWQRKVITAFSIVFLTITVAFAGVHALLMPTAQWDSLNNWNMRSQVSFYDHAIAFDQDESRGVGKSQYPILFHALQITANQGQTDWNDHAANAVMFLLALSSGCALFVCMKMLRGTTLALLGMTLITGIPIASFHFAGGYADLPLMQFLLLALVTMIIALEARDARWLLLSAAYVAAASWTKSEGLFVGLLPFLLLLVIFARKNIFPAASMIRSAVLAIVLTIPFPLFALSRGMLLTPHQSDTALAWSSEGFSRILPALFSGGSFGIGFFAVVAMTLLFVLPSNNRPVFQKHLRIALLWGHIVLVEYLVLYLFTSNVEFLLNEQSFYRQMMAPLALMGLSIITSAPSPKPLHQQHS